MTLSRFSLFGAFMIVLFPLGCGSSPPPSSAAQTVPAESKESVEGVERNIGAVPSKRPAVPRKVWWKNSSTIESMKLTPDQLEKIETIDLKYFEEIRRLRRNERIAVAKLLSALRENEPNKPHIEHSSARFIEIRTNRERVMIDRLIQLRKILTLEQWSQLKELAPVVLQIGSFRAIGEGSSPVFISTRNPATGEDSPPVETPTD